MTPKMNENAMENEPKIENNGQNLLTKESNFRIFMYIPPTNISHPQFK